MIDNLTQTFERICNRYRWLKPVWLLILVLCSFRGIIQEKCAQGKERGRIKLRSLQLKAGNGGRRDRKPVFSLRRVTAMVLSACLISTMIPMVSFAETAEQFNLPIGNYYFYDNGKWVEYRYVGTVNAYSLKNAEETADNVSAYDHSLFVSRNADDTLDTYGADYTYGNITYTKRRLSGGNSGSGRSDLGAYISGSPTTNEWNEISVKDDQYKSTTGLLSVNMKVQDVSDDGKNVIRGSHVLTHTTATGVQYIYTWGLDPEYSSKNIPALEVPASLQSNPDALKVLTLDFNGGQLRGISPAINTIKTVVKSNESFEAPRWEEEQFRGPSTATGFKEWNTKADETGTAYAAGSTVPASVDTLYATYTYPAPRFSSTTATYNFNNKTAEFTLTNKPENVTYSLYDSTGTSPVSNPTVKVVDDTLTLTYSQQPAMGNQIYQISANGGEKTKITVQIKQADSPLFSQYSVMASEGTPAIATFTLTNKLENGIYTLYDAEGTKKITTNPTVSVNGNQLMLTFSTRPTEDQKYQISVKGGEYNLPESNKRTITVTKTMTPAPKFSSNTATLESPDQSSVSYTLTNKIEEATYHLRWNEEMGDTPSMQISGNTVTLTFNESNHTAFVEYFKTHTDSATFAITAEKTGTGIPESEPCTLRLSPTRTTAPKFKETTGTLITPGNTVEFTLTNAINDSAQYAVYEGADSVTEATGVAASVSGTTLTLMFQQLPSSNKTYYISARDVTGNKFSSTRTKVTVTRSGGAYVELKNDTTVLVTFSSSATTATDTIDVQTVSSTEETTTFAVEDFSISSSDTSETPIDGVAVTKLSTPQASSAAKLTIETTKDVLSEGRRQAYLWYNHSCVGEIAIVRRTSKPSLSSSTEGFASTETNVVYFTLRDETPDTEYKVYDRSTSALLEDPAVNLDGKTLTLTFTEKPTENVSYYLKATTSGQEESDYLVITVTPYQAPSVKVPDNTEVEVTFAYGDAENVAKQTNFRGSFNKGTNKNYKFDVNDFTFSTSTTDKTPIEGIKIDSVTEYGLMWLSVEKRVDSQTAYLWYGDTYVGAVAIKRTINAASDDATLWNISLPGVTLKPSFSSDQADYTANVGNSTSSVKITLTPKHSYATIKMNDVDYDSNDSTRELEVGENVFKIKVTAEDGIATKDYQITINRELPKTATPYVTSINFTKKSAEENKAIFTLSDEPAANTTYLVYPKNGNEPLKNVTASAEGKTLTLIGIADVTTDTWFYITATALGSPESEKTGVQIKAYKAPSATLKPDGDNKVEVTFKESDQATDVKSDTIEVNLEKGTDTSVKFNVNDFSISSTEGTKTPMDGVTVTGLSGSTMTIQVEKSVTADKAYLWYKDDCVGELTVSIKTTHGITIAPDIINGTVKANAASSAQDDTLTLTVTPNDGYMLDSITVYKTDNPTLTVEVVESEGKYSFTMPDYAVTVTATFKGTDAPEFSSAEATFADAGATTVRYPLTNALTNGTYNVYAAETEGEALDDPKVKVEDNNLVLTFTDKPAQQTVYYISAKATNLVESSRTAVKVNPYVSQASPLSGTVTIDGSLKYNEKLTASLTNGNNSGELSYQWKRGDTVIIGANSNTYTTTAEDIGQTISCVVTSSIETGSVSGSTTATIDKADGPAVENVSVTGCTNDSNNDGKLSGVTTDMEYKKFGDTDYTAITSSEIIGLASGTYLVRFKETTTNKAGEDSSFTVAAYVPAPTYGVSLDQNGTYTFTGAEEGYAAQEPLTVNVSNKGNQATGELKIALSGENSGSFTLSTDTISNIAVGGKTSFTVVPNTGLSKGTYTATVKVTGSNNISASFDVKFTVSETTSLSDDATLSALQYKVGDGSAEEIPDFRADTTTYNVELPYNTDARAVITLVGTPNASEVAQITENKGVTLLNGSGTAKITVKAENNTTKTYTVIFTTAEDSRSSAKQITGFSIPNQKSSAIDQDHHTIKVIMPVGTERDGLIPTIEVSSKAEVSPKSGEPQDFTGQITYTVTAEDKSTQKYVVTVDVQTSDITEYTVTYDLTNLTANNQPTKVEKNQELKATLTAAADYKLPDSITVEMDGQELDKNEYDYNAATGKITINAVTGDVKITAEAVSETTASDDATLSKLSYRVDSGAETPVPEFDPATETYEVELPAETSLTAKITLEGTLADANATITKNQGVTLVDGAGTAKITVTAEDGSTTKTYVVSFTIGSSQPTFVAVTDITGVASEGTVGEKLTLEGTVKPDTATKKKIVWSIKEAGTTEATLDGDTLSAAKAGTVTVTATIEHGLSENEAFTKDFEITFSKESDFIAVTDITGIPETGKVQKVIAIEGKVKPSNASNQTITWEITDDGGTNAYFDADNNLIAETAGNVELTATIENGIAAGEDYIQVFVISIAETASSSDADYIETASEAVSNRRYKVEQSAAEVKSNFIAELVKLINKILEDIFGKDVERIEDTDISNLEITLDPVAGDEEDHDGQDGEFVFDVVVHKGDESREIKGLTGRILATKYTDDEQQERDKAAVEEALEIIGEISEISIPQKNALNQSKLERALKDKLQTKIKDTKAKISGIEFIGDIEYAEAGTVDNQSGNPGRFTIRVSVSKGSMQDQWSDELDGTITAEEYRLKKPVITTTSLPDGTVGSEYGAQLKATSDTDVTWSLVSGELPDGVKLDEGGELSGTPTHADSYRITVRAENGSEDGAAENTYVIKINAPSTAEEHTISASANTGGTISPSGDVTVANGGNQTFKIKASNNYYISDVLVDGVSVGRLESYEFKDVSGDHTIEAVFARGSLGPGSGSSSGSGGSGSGGSGAGSTSTTKPSTSTSTTATGDGGQVTTTKTTVTDNSGKTTTVTTNVTIDANGNVTGTTTTVTTERIETAVNEGNATITIKPDMTAAGSAASAAGATSTNPLEVLAAVPDSSIITEIQKPEVSTVNISVVAGNTTNAELTGVLLGKDAIQAAKEQGKSLTMTVTDAAGKTEAVWAIDGPALAASGAQTTDLGLSVRTVPVASEDPAAKTVQPLAASESGLVLNITGSGTLPAQARLTVPATNQTGLQAGAGVTLYRYNPAANTLAPVGNYVIDANGNVTVDLPAQTFVGTETYVLLPNGQVPGAAPAALPVPAGGTIHTVKKGEYPYLIAKQYGCSLEELLAVNHIPDVNNLQIGQELIIPGR